MADLERQLEQLRQRVARIQARSAAAPSGSPSGSGDAAFPLLFGRREAGSIAGRDPARGVPVESAAGCHWEIDAGWPAHARHGTADIGALAELPADLLGALGGEETPPAPVERWAFLDTETTGLAGGSGTLAFLTGVGWIAADGFHLKQYFLREPGEEASALTALTQLLSGFDVLITYNGKAFDVPLLDTRYAMNRMRSPFARLHHVDLLYGARRLWRLKLERCRLQDLEQRILGYERVGDVGGGFIPNLYFDYLRNGDAAPLEPVLTHNGYDILSLACLTAIVPRAFREPERLKHGEELAGLARWFVKEQRPEEAAALLRLALARPMRDALVWESLWQLADIERKLDRHEAAVAAWRELSTVANPYQAQAFERLGLHYERREKDLEQALEYTRAAHRLVPSPELEKRERRLAARLSGPHSGRLL
jgi:hypothetical protein